MGEARHSGGRSDRPPVLPARRIGYRGRRRRAGAIGSRGYRRLALPTLAVGAVLIGSGAFAATLPGDRFGAPTASTGRPAPPAVDSPAAGGLPPAQPLPPAPAPALGTAPAVEPTQPPIPTGSATATPTPTDPSPTRTPVVRSYEAETAELSGFVQIFSLPEASGGAVVGMIGRHPDSHVRFPEVVIEHPGEYELTIYYVGPQERVATLVVNGGEPVTVEFPGLDTGREVGEVSLTVILTAGDNDLWFGSVEGQEGQAPALDRITITG